MRNTCCGVLLLAGGKSSRLGQNKALLEYDGVPMIRRIAEQCVAFPEKILSSPIDLPVEGFGALPMIPQNAGRWAAL